MPMQLWNKQKQPQRISPVTVNKATSTLNAIPGGNLDLQRRLNVVNVSLNNVKQHAETQAKAAQVEAKQQAEPSQTEQEQTKQRAQNAQANANNTNKIVKVIKDVLL